MKPQTFLKKAGFTNYYLNIANEKETIEIKSLFWYVNDEINRVKTECRDFYKKLNYNDVDINKRVNQELNKLYPHIDNTLKLNGWLIRFGIWKRKHDEEYLAMLERTSKLTEDLKWKERGKFFNTHRMPKEFRFEFDGMKVKKVA